MSGRCGEGWGRVCDEALCAIRGIRGILRRTRMIGVMMAVVQRSGTGFGVTRNSVAGPAFHQAAATEVFEVSWFCGVEPYF